MKTLQKGKEQQVLKKSKGNGTTQTASSGKRGKESCSPAKAS